MNIIRKSYDISKSIDKSDDSDRADPYEIKEKTRTWLDKYLQVKD